jgi:hypothetical protein
MLVKHWTKPEYNGTMWAASSVFLRTGVVTEFAAAKKANKSFNRVRQCGALREEPGLGLSWYWVRRKDDDFVLYTRKTDRGTKTKLN